MYYDPTQLSIDVPVRPVGILYVYYDPTQLSIVVPVRPVGVLQVYDDPTCVGALVQNIKFSHNIIRRLKRKLKN